MHERAEERLGPNTCGWVEANSNVLFEKDGLAFTAGGGALLLILQLLSE